MSKAEIYKSSILDKILDSITPIEAEKGRKKMMLAAKIDDGIKAKNWKKTDFARALNKRPSEITKWLSGTHNFTADTLFEIEAVLNISLIALEDKPKEQVTKYHATATKDNVKALTTTDFQYICIITSFPVQSTRLKSVSSSNFNKIQIQCLQS